MQKLTDSVMSNNTYFSNFEIKNTLFKIMVAVKSGSGQHLFLIHFKFPDTLKKSIYPKSVLLSIFYFSDIKKIILYNILMMLNKGIIQ